ncbi:hypothetical protein HPP92_021795 [Vanilla planifolia]|uniref:Uncharacterized protein n=1 Tax=Vanilla planifolia TaxID=51239 RepID=A0A835UDA5_VANPL|nr:hypothetical protein HPP92_022127 [Vanilla planifolia]KAG0458667.1 hypothetical protein HPP92_021795 [Vanilla planifolia]
MKAAAVADITSMELEDRVMGTWHSVQSLYGNLASRVSFDTGGPGATADCRNQRILPWMKSDIGRREREGGNTYLGMEKLNPWKGEGEGVVEGTVEE